mmetsp:Transcript_10398/g.14694  ORF Transcript_10398/g.14694 Transcript_10398/m.14694 type:complete len:202 (+) Transcript_10398:711-1316(+)
MPFETIPYWYPSWRSTTRSGHCNPSETLVNSAGPKRYSFTPMPHKCSARCPSTSTIFASISCPSPVTRSTDPRASERSTYVADRACVSNPSSPVEDRRGVSEAAPFPITYALAWVPHAISHPERWNTIPNGSNTFPTNSNRESETPYPKSCRMAIRTIDIPDVSIIPLPTSRARVCSWPSRMLPSVPDRHVPPQALNPVTF